MELKEITSKKIEILGKTIPVTVIALLLIAGAGTAALLSYYGVISGTANVEQSVVFGDGDTTKSFSFSPVTAGNTILDEFKLWNKAEDPVGVEFETTIEASYDGDECSGTAEDAITTEYLSVLELSSKTYTDINDPSTWETTDDREATLTYKLVSDCFEYELEASGLEANTEYSMIYYADRQDRFENWGGDNPGRLLGTFTSNNDGEYSTSDFVTSSVCIDLPASSDWNANSEADYCVSDNYESCRGAKVWIVPSGDYDSGVKKLTAWNPDNYLYETDLITFDAGLDGLNIYNGKIELNVENSFHEAACPGDYTVTTEIVPVSDE